MADGIVVAARVKPGAKRALVGGSWGEPPALVVAVRERAVEGRATDAVARALADALGVAVRDVTLMSGARSRSKVFRVVGDPAALRARLARLLGVEADTPSAHDHQ